MGNKAVITCVRLRGVCSSRWLEDVDRDRLLSRNWWNRVGSFRTLASVTSDTHTHTQAGVTGCCSGVGVCVCV